MEQWDNSDAKACVNSSFSKANCSMKRPVLLLGLKCDLLWQHQTIKWRMTNPMRELNLKTFPYKLATNRKYIKDYTSEIKALILIIILIWSGGIFTDETSRVDCPFSGSKVMLEASLPSEDAFWFISWMEVSGIALNWWTDIPTKRKLNITKNKKRLIFSHCPLVIKIFYLPKKE